MELIDTHCHLDTTAFANDLDAVLVRANAADIRAFIVPAIDQAHWQPLNELTENQPELYPAYGLHPMFMQMHAEEHLEQLDRWLDQHPAVAVGECGLDFYIPEHDRHAQLQLFEAQLHIARNHQLPVIIHCRKAMDQVIQLLRRIRPLTGVLHSFNGSLQQARQCMDLGFSFGIGGPVTYPRAKKYRRLLQALPREHLLLETDAPDQPVRGHQGQRNEPSLMIHVLHALAELRDETTKEVAAYTSANARALFNLPMAQDS